MSKLKHLNYCREIKAQFTKDLTIEQRPVVAALKQCCLDQLATAQKFILPDGGVLGGDMGLKALDESEPLRLPFPTIALEYERSPEFLSAYPQVKPEMTQPSKTVILIEELPEDDILAISPILWLDQYNSWTPLPSIALNTTQYLSRKKDEIVVNMHANAMPPLPPSDYVDEVSVTLGFLNILQCSNVDITASPVSTVRKAIATRKQALPYDSYYILTIGNSAPQTKSIPTGTHRSPREHLRRGHIRRLPTGRRVWVNATIVAAGSTGHITKTYAVGAC